MRDSIQSAKTSTLSPTKRLKSLIIITGIALFTIATLLFPKQAKAFSGAGNGSLGDPFVITTCTQLQEMKDNLTASYRLGGDIDCSDTVNWNEANVYGNLNQPYAVAVDTSGNTYTVNIYENNVRKFDSSGTYVAQWGSAGSGDGQFNGPAGITIDGSGNIYIVDSGNSRVEKFDSSGNYLSQFGSYGNGNGQFNGPAGITIDGSGNIYIVDTYNNRIQKFDSLGNYLSQFGSYGSGDSQFFSPVDMTIDASGNIYVLDYGNSRIEKFNSTGTYLTQWGSQGQGNGQFYYPRGITKDSNNNIYVADTYNSRIQKFDSTGTYLGQWGSSGFGDGQFYSPWGITSDSNDRIYVADTNTLRVQKFTASGSFLTKYYDGQVVGTKKLGFEPVGRTTPFTGSLDGNNHTVTNLTINRANDTPQDNNPEDEWYVGLFGNTNGATVENVNITNAKIKGYQYVGGIIGYMQNGVLQNSTVNKTTPDNSCNPGYCVWARYGQFGGGLVGYLDGTGVVTNSSTAGPVKGSGYQIGGLIGYMNSGTLSNSSSSSNTDAGSGDGGAIGAMQGGTVSRVFATGNAMANVDESSGKSGRDVGGFVGQMYGGVINNSYATGTVTADNGSAGGFAGVMGGGTITNSYSSGAVTLTSPSNSGSGFGGFVGTLSTYGDTIIQNSFTVSAVNSTQLPAGFVGMLYNYIDPNSSPAHPQPLVNVYYDVSRTGYSICYNQPNAGSGNGQFSSPGGVTTDTGNNTYVADTGNNRIEKFDSSGNYLTQWGSYGNGNGQFANPYAVTTDSNGNVYVADMSNHRIQKFDSSGNYLTQWGSLGSGNGELIDPYGVKADGSGNVYVVDTGNNRIQKFDSSGNYLTQWGSSGNGNGQFDHPINITTDSNGSIYVTDANNSRVQKFDSSGNYLLQWGSAGSGDGQFYYAYGITADSDNNIYVSDAGNSRIEKFDSSGNYLSQWGSNGNADGQFSNVLGITSNTNNSIYAADAGNNNVQEFDSSGSFISKISGPATGNTGCNSVNSNNSNPEYFYDYANNPFTISGTRTWPANVWLFSGSAYPIFCDTNNCQSVLPPNADNDGDGITNGVEDAAPNGGDGNNDGTLDALQAHVTSYVSQSTNGYVTIVGPNGSQLTAVNSQSAPNTNYSFPFGLIGFTLSGITPGSTAQITMLFPSSRNPSDLLARKYFPNSQSYLDIPGATTSTVTIATQPTIQLVYSVTDGSNLDLDGVVNGSITDPVGLADRNSGALANTGENSYIIIFSALGLILTGGYLARKNLLS